MSAFVDKTMFMAYAKSTWDMSQRHANRLIAASDVIENLGPRGLLLPSYEKHVRHLTKLPADQQVEAWNMALEVAPVGKATDKVGGHILREGHR